MVIGELAVSEPVNGPRWRGFRRACMTGRGRRVVVRPFDATDNDAADN